MKNVNINRVITVCLEFYLKKGVYSESFKLHFHKAACKYCVPMFWSDIYFKYVQIQVYARLDANVLVILAFKYINQVRIYNMQSRMLGRENQVNFNEKFILLSKILVLINFVCVRSVCRNCSFCLLFSIR